MRPVKKLQPFSPKLMDPPQKAVILREEAMAALTIYFLSKSLPTPSYVLEKQFLEVFGHTWQTTSDEIWGYLKDVQPNFARTPQEIYDAYIKLVSMSKNEKELASKDEKRSYQEQHHS